MKTAAWIISALMLTWAAYSVTPDLRRYLKIHAM
jgi:hypothetical protein